jgi:hypothetical protein
MPLFNSIKPDLFILEKKKKKKKRKRMLNFPSS